MRQWGRDFAAFIGLPGCAFRHPAEGIGHEGRGGGHDSVRASVPVPDPDCARVPQLHSRPHARRRLPLTAAILVGLLPVTIAVIQAADTPVHTFRVPVTSFALRVDPAEQTVPAGVPARVHTWVELPDPGASYAASLQAYLSSDYTVRATLYAPQADGASGIRDVECPVGGEFVLDGLAEPGRYWLREIRLVSRRDGRDFLFAQPESVAVDVGGDLFIAWVTAEPMTWEEMNAAGVVFDDDSYQNYNFVIGFELEGRVVEYEFPVVQTPPALPVTPSDWAGLGSGGGDCIISEVDLELGGVSIPGLPPGDVRLPGLILIPGSVGFLRQHFQVVLLLVNALPPSSGYALADLTATAGLPGPQGCPDDAPLCLATLAAAPNAPEQPVLADGGSTVLAPGQSGNAEWVVVGRETGYHEFPIAIEGLLRTESGDRSWPISGSARGGIAVRDDPRFRLTFIHPDRVERGAEYHVSIHVSNIGATPANGFRLAIDLNALTGVEWVGAQYPDPPAGQTPPECPPGGDTFCWGELDPGETVVLRHTLRALRSGMVTATYGDTDSGSLELGARLVFGVDTDGMPMNADRLILPPVVSPAWAAHFPAGLEEAALHFLGLCHSLSTAGAAPLPEGLPRVASGTPPALARAMAESALALTAGMPAEEAASLLLRDIAGLARSDDGFRRALTLPPGGEFLELLGAAVPGGGATLAARCGHGNDLALVETALTATGGDPAALSLPVAGGSLRWLPLEEETAEVRLLASSSGVHTLTLWTPAASERYRRLSYSLNLSPGDVVSVPAAVQGGTANRLRITHAGGLSVEAAPAQEQSVPLAPFRMAGVLKLNPELLTGADAFGRGVLAVLNRRVAVSATQAAAVCAMAGNEVLTAAPLVSGRILGVVLNRPVGKLVPATLGVNGLRSADGAVLAAAAAPVAIPNPASACERGVRVEGRVRYPAGPPVVEPLLELWGVVNTWRGRQDVCLSRFGGGADGTFRLDFVWMNPAGMYLVATDPSTGARRRMPLVMAVDGQLLEPEILMFGTGTVVGEVIAADGSPRTDIHWVTVRSEGDNRSILARLEGGGRFRADGVSVGAVQVEGLLSDRQRLRGSTHISQPGEVAALFLVAGAGAIHGQVRELSSEGIIRGVPGARLELSCFWTLSGQTVLTDDDGRFRFNGVPPGPFRIRAAHPAVPRVAVAEGTLPEQAAAEQAVDLMFEDGVPLLVQVRTEPGSLPVASARVEIELEDPFEQLRLDAVTGLSGDVSVQGLPPGRYRITAGRFGVTTTETRYAWLGGAGATVVVTVQSAAQVQGVVRRADGSPAAGATVRIGPASATTDSSASSDGRFSLYVPPGGHKFQAWTPTEAESGWATVAPGGTAMEIRLRGRRTVRGTVRAQQSNGQSMTVRVPLNLNGLYRGGTGEMEYRDTLASILSADDGTFTFSGVWDGPFELRFNGNTFYAPARRSGLAPGADVEGFDLLLQPVATTGPVTGTLLQRDGATSARSGIPLTLTGSDQRTRDARTVEGGGFAFSPPLPPGHYVLEAEDLYAGDRAFQELYFSGMGDQAVTLAMLGRHVLRVHLFDAAGQRLDEAWLSVVRQGKPALERQAESVWDTEFSGGPNDPRWFEFEDLWSGDYSVTATALVDGAAQSVSGGATLSGDGTEADLTLTLAPTVTVRGTVLDRAADAGGRPVTGAEITLRDALGLPAGTAVTSAEMATQGQFSLPAVRTGRYTLEAQDFATGQRGALSVEIDAAAGDPAPVTLALEELGIVSGVVFAADDPPPHECAGTSGRGGMTLSLGVLPAAGSAYPARNLAGTTGPDGRFEFHGIPAGRVSLEARSGAGVTGYGEVEVEPGGQACLAVTLGATHTVNGRVRRAGSAEGAAYARVELLPGQSGVSCTPGGRSYRVTADADGEFTIGDVLAGCYTLSAWTGSGMNRASVPVAAEDGVVVDLELGGLGRLQGTVTDRAGAVAHARVRLSAGGLELSTDAGSDGAFFFPEAPAGAFELRAEDVPTARLGTASGELADGGEITGFELPLEPSFLLTGRLRNEDEEPLSGVWVTYTFTRPDGTPGVRSDVTDFSGYFDLLKVPLLPGWLGVDDPVHGRCRLFRDLAGVVDGGVDNVGDRVLDATPPQVAVSFQSPGAAVEPGRPVPLDAFIRLTFSEEIDLEWLSAHPEWVRLVRDPDGGALPVTVSVQPDPEGLVVDLYPAAWMDSSAYRLSVSGQVRDRNGNVLGAEVVTLFRTVDVTPPGVAALAPASGAVEVASETEVWITFSEPMDTAAGTVSWLRNGEPDAVTLSWSADGVALQLIPSGGLPADGRYAVTLEGFLDLSGNALPATSCTFDTLDTLPPVIESDACGTVFPMGQPELAVTYHDALCQVDTASVHAELSGPGVAGEPVALLGASEFEARFQLRAGLPNGEWTLTVHAADARGHEAAFPCAFTLDRSEIAFLGHTPAEGVLAVGNPVPVTVDIWSARPLVEAALVLNGTALSVIPAMEGDHYLAQVAYPVPSDGWVTVSARATDDQGFTSVPAMFSFLADAYAPGLSLGFPQSQPCDATPALSFTSSDAGAGVDPAASRVWIDGVDRTAEFAITAAGGSWMEEAATPLGAGVHNLFVRTADLAGHTNQTETNFRLDDQPPGIRLDWPTNGVSVTADSVEFQAYLGDNCALDPDTAAVFVNGHAWTEFQLTDGMLTGTLVWDDPRLALGDNAWTVRVRDALGTEGTASGSFQIVRTVPLPYALSDGNGYAYRVGPDGGLAWDPIVPGADWPVLPALTVWIGGAPYALAPRAEGVVALDRSEIRVDGPLDIETRRLEQRLHVDKTGCQARVQAWLSNADASGVPVTVEAAFILPESLGWSVAATSGGDAVADPADGWLVVDDDVDQDDALGVNLPALGVLVAGGFPARGPDEVVAEPGRLVLRWVDLPLPPGTPESPGRLGLALAVTPQPTRSAAAAALDRLSAGPAELLAGVPEDRWARVVNLDWSGGPDPSLEPLPALTGGVSGTVRDATPDGHPLEYRTVLASSQSPFFRRARVMTSNSQGRFVFGAPDHRPALPLGEVEILAGSVNCGFAPAGAVTLTDAMPVQTDVDLPVALTGAVDLTVRLSSGGLLPAGSAQLEAAAGSCSLAADVIDGLALLAGVPAGDYTLTVASDFGGTSVPVTVSAGVASIVEVVLSQRALAVRLVDAAGQGVPGVAVHVCQGSTLLASPLSDGGGTAVLLEPPGDASLDLLALHPDGRWALRTDVSVPSDGSLRLDNVFLQPAGSVRARAEDAAGQPLSGVGIRISFPGFPAELALEEATGADGEAVLAGVPAGLPLEWAVRPPASSWVSMYGFEVAPGQERQLMYVSGALFYTVQGTVRAADNTTAVPWAALELHRQTGPDSFEFAVGVSTDSAGAFRFQNVKLPSPRARLVVRWPSSQGQGEDILSLALPVAGSLSVTTQISLLNVEVRDGQGQVVSAADFPAIQPHDPRLGAPLWRGADGVFRLFGARPGALYDLSAWDGQGGFFCTTGGLPENQLQGPVVTLAPCSVYTVNGTLQAADASTPVPLHAVTLWKETPAGGFYRHGEPACTDESGFFFWESLHLPTGRARLVVRLPESQGGGEDSLLVDLSAGGDVVFPSALTLVGGEVRNGSGDVVEVSGYLSVIPHDAGAPMPRDAQARLVQGAFTVFGLPPGQVFDALAYDADWNAYGGILEIPDGQAVQTGVVLTPVVPSSVEGTLRAADGQTFLPTIAAPRLDKELSGGAFVNAGAAYMDVDGYFSAGGHFPTGRARLVVPHPASQGGGEDVFLLTLPGDSPADRTTGWAVARGDVLDATGGLVAGAYGLDAIPAGPVLPPLERDQVAMADGQWIVIGLSPGRDYSLVAWGPGGSFHCANVSLPAGQLVAEGLHLEPCQPSAAEVRLTVLDSQGQPAAGVAITLNQGGAGWYFDRLTTDAAGVVVFRNVPPGVFRAWAGWDSEMGTGLDLGVIGVSLGTVLVEQILVVPDEVEPWDGCGK